MLGEDSTGNLICSLLFSITLLSKFTLASVCTVFFLQVSSLDESEEEERTRLATKEEEDVDVLQSWIEVGGLPAHPEEEAKGLLAEVNSFPCFSHAAFLSPSLICYQFFPHNLGIGLLLAISSFFLGVEIAPPG